MEWIEVTARTVEEAKELALDRLGVVEDELEYEVLDPPKPGLFGRLGRSDARIRARVRPLSREKPSDRRRRRPRERGNERRPRETRPDGGGRASGGTRSAQSTSSASSAPSEGRGRRRRSPAARAEGETVEERSRVPMEDQSEAALAFTRGLVQAFGARAVVRAEVVDDTITIDVDGDKLGLLVGPRGATLTAFEELVRAAVQRRTGGHSARVNVDVGGYRLRRREALAGFVRGLAEEVLVSGEARALEPMMAADRKVVHDTVAEMAGLATASEGEDPRRRVVITPA